MLLNILQYTRQFPPQRIILSNKKKGGWGGGNYTSHMLNYIFLFFCSLSDTTELLNYPSVYVRTNKRFNSCWKETPYFFLFFQNFLLCMYIHFFIDEISLLLASQLGDISQGPGSHILESCMGTSLVVWWLDSMLPG